MRQLIAGNWKMHGNAASAVALAEGLRGARDLACDLLVCPPFVHLAGVALALRGSAVALGAQDCHAAAEGAHTGDISAPMLADFGATFVIVGHSERRQNHGETDEMVRAKAEAAIKAGLTPIICVGETEAERVASWHEAVVGRQIAGSLPEGFAGVAAYEPVWAIGTGRTPTEADVAAMHGFIRGALVQAAGERGRAVRILYGGSVKPANAQALLALPDVGGALVGGASLKAEDFLGIAKASS